MVQRRSSKPDERWGKKITRALVGWQSDPIEVAFDLSGGAGDETLAVRVLDAQHEAAVPRLGEQVIVQRRPQSAQMDVACRDDSASVHFFAFILVCCCFHDGMQFGVVLD